MLIITVARKVIFALITILLFPLLPENEKSFQRILLALPPTILYGATALIPMRRFRTTVAVILILFWAILFSFRRKRNRFKRFCLSVGAVGISLSVYCISTVACYAVAFPFTRNHNVLEFLVIPVFCMIFQYFRKKKAFDHIIHAAENSLAISVFMCQTVISLSMYFILYNPYQPLFRKYYIIALLALSASEICIFLLSHLMSSYRKIASDIVHDNHSRKHDIESLERRLEKMERRSFTASASDMSEFSDEIAVTREELREIIDREQKQARASLLASISLPTTGMPVLDSQISIFFEKCVQADVELNLYVRSSLLDFARQETISLEVLRRVVGILADNALAAFPPSDAPSADTIHILMGYKGGSYCIEVLDNAPPFSSRILREIGAMGNTTNGTGYGIPDLLSAIIPYRASFIIRELSDRRTQLTKSIMIRFDGHGHRVVVTNHPSLLRLKQNDYGFVFINQEQGKDV